MKFVPDVMKFLPDFAQTINGTGRWMELHEIIMLPATAIAKTDT